MKLKKTHSQFTDRNKTIIRISGIDELLQASDNETLKSTRGNQDSRGFI